LLTLLNQILDEIVGVAGELSAVVLIDLLQRTEAVKVTRDEDIGVAARMSRLTRADMQVVGRGVQERGEGFLDVGHRLELLRKLQLELATWGVESLLVEMVGRHFSGANFLDHAVSDGLLKEMWGVLTEVENVLRH